MGLPEDRGLGQGSEGLPLDPLDAAFERRWKAGEDAGEVIREDLMRAREESATKRLGHAMFGGGVGSQIEQNVASKVGYLETSLKLDRLDRSYFEDDSPGQRWLLDTVKKDIAGVLGCREAMVESKLQTRGGSIVDIRVHGEETQGAAGLVAMAKGLRVQFKDTNSMLYTGEVTKAVDPNFVCTIKVLESLEALPQASMGIQHIQPQNLSGGYQSVQGAIDAALKQGPGLDEFGSSSSGMFPMQSHAIESAHTGFDPLLSIASQEQRSVEAWLEKDDGPAMFRQATPLAENKVSEKKASKIPSPPGVRKASTVKKSKSPKVSPRQSPTLSPQVSKIPSVSSPSKTSPGGTKPKKRVIKIPSGSPTRLGRSKPPSI